MQKTVKTFILPLAPVLWLAAGTAWFAWHGWQEVHSPNPFATPGYFDWLRYLERLTPPWSAALALALLAFVAGGWFVWQQSRFDRWLLAATGAVGLGLALCRPIALPRKWSSPPMISAGNSTSRRRRSIDGARAG